MKLKVTIDIFSGRPNPTAILEGKEAKAMLDKLSVGSTFKKTSARQLPEPFNLGYRGVIVEPLDNNTAKAVPASVRVTPGRAYSAAAMSASASDNFEQAIFDKLNKFKNVGNKKDFKRVLEASMGEFRMHRETIKTMAARGSSVDDVITPMAAGPCDCAPDPDLAWWNDNGARQFNNNCYNYASNYRTDTFAQPGKAAGKQYTSLSGCAVAAGKISAKMGAIADALMDSPTANNICPPKGHLVALVIAPNADFHWYRKGNNGFWSHKPGSTAATILDNSGNKITDPRTANRGIYTQFCTFMTVLHGHIKIK